MIQYARPPWVPGFRLAQAPAPAVAPTAPAAAAANGNGKAPSLLAGAFALGVGTVGTLFTYGLASETKSSMVRTTGYILAGLSALATVLGAVGLVTGGSK